MNTQSAPEGAPVPADSPHMRVLAQYVKELSFRNAAAATAQAYDIQPTIDMGVEVKSRSMGERADLFEVDLCVNVQGIRGFHKALTDAGIDHVYYESPGTDHEWQTWRRDLHDFAPRLFR